LLLLYGLHSPSAGKLTLVIHVIGLLWAGVGRTAPATLA
jgi:hypothetical protein